MANRAPAVLQDIARAHRWLEATRRLTHDIAAPGRDGPWRQRAARERLHALSAAMRPDDTWARGHATRVGALCGRLARAIGLTPDEAEVVALAGILHDIGILGEPCTAADGEAVHWRCRGPGLPEGDRHPAIGAQLVAPFDLLALAAPMIRHHHERLDGSGYPDGLRGERIPIGARIIAVADEYDRLVTAAGGALPRVDALTRLTAQAQQTLDGAVLAALAGQEPLSSRPDPPPGWR